MTGACVLTSDEYTLEDMRKDKSQMMWLMDPSLGGSRMGTQYTFKWDQLKIRHLEWKIMGKVIGSWVPMSAYAKR